MTTALLAQVTLNQEVTPHRCAHKTKNNVFSRSRAPARQSAQPGSAGRWHRLLPPQEGPGEIYGGLWWY